MTSILKKGLDFIKDNPGGLTEKELRVLELYAQYSPKVIKNKYGITRSEVYSVFQRIRNRRERAQLLVNFFNALCKDKRFRQVLSPRIRYDENYTEAF